MKLVRAFFEKYKQQHSLLDSVPAYLKFKEDLSIGEFHELMRLAEIGWEVEDHKRKLHVAHCNGVHCTKPEFHPKEVARA